MAVKQNKGEWSELYAFFRLVNDKKISVCNSNLDVDKSYEIVSFKFLSQNDNSDITVSLSEQSVLIKNKLMILKN